VCVHRAVALLVALFRVTHVLQELRVDLKAGRRVRNRVKKCQKQVQEVLQELRVHLKAGRGGPETGSRRVRNRFRKRQAWRSKAP
jgi:hypothetical protein